MNTKNKFSALKVIQFDNHFEIWNGTNNGKYNFDGSLIQCNIGFTDEAIQYALKLLKK